MKNILMYASVIFVVWIPDAIADSSLSSGTSSFTANCDQSSARTFLDIDTEASGKSSKWIDHETQEFIQLLFQYDGSKDLSINEDQAEIVANQNGVMLAISHYSLKPDSYGSYANMYAIHLGLKRIVALTAGGYSDAYGDSLFGTVTELTCIFE